MGGNIGGYDENTYKDKESVDYLSKVLEDSRLFKTHFDQNDKTPNFDGFFEICGLCEKKSIPLGRFDVQIKTISNYLNTNERPQSRYKYSCDTKIFNAAEEALTLNPILLFLVDMPNSKIFWKYLSEQYVLQQSIEEIRNKTIFFDDENSIDDIEKFYGEAKEIYLYEKKKKKSLISNLILTDGSNIETQYKLIEQIIYLNNSIDNELYFLKKTFWNDVWKFGIALTERETGAWINIYRIFVDSDGNIIKNFQQSNDIFMSFQNYQHSDGKIDIEKNVWNFINRPINDFFEKKYIDACYLSTEVLMEVSFVFLDKLAAFINSFKRNSPPFIYYKDEEEVESIRHIWNTLKEHINLYLNTSFVNSPNTTFVINPLSYLSVQSSKFERIYSSDFTFSGFQGKVEFDSFCSFWDEAIVELERREIKTVKRIWDITTGSEDRNTYYSNLDTLFELLPKSYTETAQQFYKEEFEQLSTKKKIVICYDEKNFMFKYFYLDNTEFTIENNPSWENNEGPTPIQYKCAGSCYCNWAFSSETPLYSHVARLIYKGVCKKYNMPIKTANISIFSCIDSVKI